MDKISISTKWSELFPAYQSANSSDETVKANFIVRKAEFEIIIGSLLDKSKNDSVQHELILGRRGSGKSTLLKRIEVELGENSQLKKKYIPVNLAEEQAGIYRLMDLWTETLQELECRLEIKIPLKEYSEFAENQDYTRYLYQEIHKICEQQKRKIVLLLDNFDRIVDNFTDDGNLLRETLINYSDLVLITASTRMEEHFWQYDQPFYEFFRRHHLGTLSREETFELLEHWSNALGLPQISAFIKNHPGKVENVRLLTDGLPRTMHFFMEIVLQNDPTVDVDFLKKIMDEATPQYQERLNNLTPQMRKIVLEMAFIWEACSTKQLVEKCKMESKLISANLKTLSDKNVVEKIETDKRNHLYRISERFFNMWLIITQGNPDQKRKARWVSVFLENWYDANELQDLAHQHIDNLKGNKFNFLLSKGLCQSKYITIFDRDKIIELNETNEGKYLVELPKKVAKIAEEIYNYIETADFKNAFELANSIENEEDGGKYFIIGDIYRYQGKYEEAEKYYLLAIEKGYDDALYNLALLYDNQGKYEEAEKYYLLDIKEGYNMALNNLGYLYIKQKKYDLSEKYFLLAIKKRVDLALNNLGLLYHNQGKYEEAEKYYLLAIEKGVDYALFNLSLMYYAQNKNKEKAKQYISQYKGNDIFAVMIEIWLGIFNNVENRVIAAFRENMNSKMQSLVIKSLLIFHQKSLVEKLFNHQEFGQKLQEQYTVLYYASQILNNKEDDNLLLKIPPELESTVKDVLKEIKSLQEFYG